MAITSASKGLTPTVMGGKAMSNKQHPNWLQGVGKRPGVLGAKAKQSAKPRTK